MHVVCANARGLTGTFQNIFSELWVRKADIGILTGTNTRQQDKDKFRKAWGRSGAIPSLYMDSSQEEFREKGVLITFRPGMVQEKKAVVRQGSGRYILVVAVIGSETIIVGGVYGDPSSNDRLGAEVMTQLKEDLEQLRDIHSQA